MINSSQLNSLVFSALISILYPASLYLWPKALTSDRQNPKTIKRNFLSVIGASFLSAQVLIWHKQWHDPDYQPSYTILHYLNWKSYDSSWDFFFYCLAQPMLHVLVLFAGPLYHDLQSFRQEYLSRIKCDSLSIVIKVIGYIAKQFLELAVIRNLIVAPLTEEFIFRGVVLSILTPFWSNATAIIISSLLFGLMHTHHFLRSFLVTRQVSKRDALSCLVQCAYTALFGAYASVAYLASGHLITPIVLHSFCNLNGLPNFPEIVSNKSHFYLTIVGFVFWLCYLFPMASAAL